MGKGAGECYFLKKKKEMPPFNNATRKAEKEQVLINENNALSLSVVKKKKKMPLSNNAIKPKKSNF